MPLPEPVSPSPIARRDVGGQREEARWMLMSAAIGQRTPPPLTDTVAVRSVSRMDSYV